MKSGYIDKMGSMVIKPQFDAVGRFSEGLAEVKKGGKWGYIDKTGSFVIKPQFFPYANLGRLYEAKRQYRQALQNYKRTLGEQPITPSLCGRSAASRQ